MKRGEIWTVAGGSDYMGKPRPAVIVQDDNFSETKSVTVCPLTTSNVDAPFMRIMIEPTVENGLTEPSFIMVDKLTTISRLKAKRQIGALKDADLEALSFAMAVFLGLMSD